MGIDATRHQDARAWPVGRKDGGNAVTVDDKRAIDDASIGHDADVLYN
jgi:hypothetical protein